MEADYTGALTLLLRYPVPSKPHDASSFVGDARYLRDNLQTDGGDHLIEKYSSKTPETTVTRKLPKKMRRARTETKPFHMAAAKFLQDPSGIDHVIQEAARNVYQQGERWGVAQAVRGAIQGLQSQSRPVQTRWSLDKGRPVHDDDLVQRIDRLESRNKELAKMLGNAIDEIWTHSNTVQSSNHLNIAVGKMRDVQAHLEDSLLVLPVHPRRSLPEMDGTIEEARPCTPPGPSTPPARPPLSQSPYAWMLGDGPGKSDFVASTLSPTALAPAKSVSSGQTGARRMLQDNQMILKPPPGTDKESPDNKRPQASPASRKKGNVLISKVKSLDMLDMHSGGETEADGKRSTVPPS